MTNLEEFLAGLDPKTAKRIRTAQETELERLPLASYSLTKALGGGIAKGRIATFYGNQSAGKSLLMQESIGKIWQPAGLVCAYVDVESAYDKEWALRLGVNNKELILSSTKSSGKIENDLVPLIQNGLDVVVIDSISDIMPEAFVDKDGVMNEQDARKQMGAHAKAITALINGLLYVNENTAIVLLSQTTTKFETWGAVQVPHGGNKTLFASSQIVRLSSSPTEKNQIKGELWVGDMVFEESIGRTVRGVVEKNKLGKQSGTFEYPMYYAGKTVGIDSITEVISEAVKYDVISKGGAWYTFEGQKWQGSPNVVEYFKSNPEELERVKKQIHVKETGEL
jgi:recombination protein RecA